MSMVQVDGPGRWSSWMVQLDGPGRWSSWMVQVDGIDMRWAVALVSSSQMSGVCQPSPPIALGGCHCEGNHKEVVSSIGSFNPDWRPASESFEHCRDSR